MKPEHQQIANRIAAKNKQRRERGIRSRRKAREVTADQRKRLRDSSFKHQRKIAEAADDLHPIRAERLRLGATQAELAEAALIHPSSVARLERGEFSPTKMMQRRIEQAFKNIARRAR